MTKVKKTTNDSYFSWLCSIVSDPAEDNDHYELLMLLFQTDFYAIVPNDDNRISDAEELRRTYYGDSEEYQIPGCTVLEMLIALAQRMDYFLMDSNIDIGASGLFWEMIENLSLYRFTDDRWNRTTARQAESLLLQFLSREYDWDGRGGLFPLKSHPNVDQKDVEIWQQMQSYLIERYPIG